MHKLGTFLLQDPDPRSTTNKYAPPHLYLRSIYCEINQQFGNKSFIGFSPVGQDKPVVAIIF